MQTNFLYLIDRFLKQEDFKIIRTVKRILKGNKIILEENIPLPGEQTNLLTLLDKSSLQEKVIVLAGIQNGLEDKENGNILTFEESFELLEELVDLRLL